MIAIRDRLREMYGPKVNEPHGHPIAELVRTDPLPEHQRPQPRRRLHPDARGLPDLGGGPRRPGRATSRRRCAPAGSHQQKAPRIQHILGQLGEHPDLDWIATAPRDEALEFLTDLPGVGRKTAACVMIFTYDRPEIPVDTHVHRVGGRLGLFRPNASFDEAHDEMLAITPPGDEYELHVNLIHHGRALCRPRPRCGECDLRRMCPWYRANA